MASDDTSTPIYNRPFPCLVIPQPAAARDCVQSASVMSSADYGERGGTAAATSSRATSAVHSPADHSHHPSGPVQQLFLSLDDTDSSTWPSSLGSSNTANTTSTDQSPANLSSTATTNFSSRSSQNSKSTNPTSGSNLDLPTPDALARNESLLRDAVFPEWKDDTSPSDVENPEEMQKKDPLGTQIWKLYSRTKSRLPNQERMENLTWRMMAMNLRRREQMQAAWQQNATSSLRGGDGTDSVPNVKQPQLKRPSIPPSTPSGIAQQLRKSIDKSTESEQLPDPMNLDEFIVPSSFASPAGILTPATTEHTPQPKNTQPAGVPIASRNKPQVQIPKNLPPSSMPQTSVPTYRTSEFDYVRKRVRKTSIDERRGGGGVSHPHVPAHHIVF